jgi:hypothetical protein
MTATQDQDIIVYASRSDILTGILIGVFCLLLGIVILFLGKWQFPALGASLVFIIGSVLSWIFAWKMVHHPLFIINAEGIRSLHPMLRIDIKWEEIDAIYRINTRTAIVFAVDLSSTGLNAFFARKGKRIPWRLDTTVPQLALGIRQSNLPLPVDQLLTQIHERFSAQIEHYHIYLDGGILKTRKPLRKSFVAFVAHCPSAAPRWTTWSTIRRAATAWPSTTPGRSSRCSTIVPTGPWTIPGAHLTGLAN